MTVNPVFGAFCRLYLKIALFCAKPSGQILCHVTDVKCYDVLVDCITTLVVFDYPKFQQFLSNTLQSRNVGVRSVGTKVDFNFEKNACSFLHVGLSI